VTVRARTCSGERVWGKGKLGGRVLLVQPFKTFVTTAVLFRSFQPVPQAKVQWRWVLFLF